LSAVRTSSVPDAGPASLVVTLPAPYLLFLGDTTEAGYAKTAFGLRDWARDLCIGEFALPEATVSAGLPKLKPHEAQARGARSLVIGVANTGGVLKPNWIPSLVEGLEAGLDIVSGMHGRLAGSRELKAAADRLGRNLIDVRQPPPNIPVGTGRKRTGKRLLTVGTDCALGKKYTALAITGAMRRRGVDADFRATGQTGIMIAGSGMPMDAVISDFVAGAAEILSPDAAADHWDVIEGQGSLFHPAYAGVSLGLLHGSQPDVFVLCHEPGREHLLGYPDFPTPSLPEAIARHITMGSLTNAKIRCAGVSFNTASLRPATADTLMQGVAQTLGLPVADPMRGGAALERLIESCLAS
jgi:D-glutamate N-acetyltransferase